MKKQYLLATALVMVVIGFVVMKGRLYTMGQQPSSPSPAARVDAWIKNFYAIIDKNYPNFKELPQELQSAIMVDFLNGFLKKRVEEKEAYGLTRDQWILAILTMANNYKKYSKPFIDLIYSNKFLAYGPGMSPLQVAQRYRFNDQLYLMKQKDVTIWNQLYRALYTGNLDLFKKVQDETKYDVHYVGQGGYSLYDMMDSSQHMMYPSFEYENEAQWDKEMSELEEALKNLRSSFSKK